MRIGRSAFAALAVALATASLSHASSEPRCIGPRQTADRLSPPCIPSWSGSNGGATWDGVASDSVTLVVYNDLGIDGDLRIPWMPTDEAATHFLDVDGSTRNLVRTAKALIEFFDARYETYGRRLEAIAVSSSSGEATSCAARESDIEAAIVAHRPFAIVPVGSDLGCAIGRAARAGVPSLGSFELTRAWQVAGNPALVHSFAPMLEQIDDALAGFLCRSLLGRPARYATGTLAGAQRTVGVVFPAGADHALAAHAAGIGDAVTARCGRTITLTRSYRPGNTTELVNAIAGMATAQITTLVCLCPAPNGDARTALAAATALSYAPEWIWSPATRMDRAAWHRRGGPSLGRHVGITDLWLAPARDQQVAFLAAVAMDPSLDPNPRWTTALYTGLRTAASGIQLAGPLLTPGSVRTGLAMLAYNVPADPATVSGSFADPTPMSFTDTFALWRWESREETPGEPGPRGCIQLLADGYRFEASTWPTDDLVLGRSGRCTGSLERTSLEESPLIPLSIIAPTG